MAFEAVILANQPAIELRLAQAMLDSLGTLSDTQLVGQDDSQDFTIDMHDPTQPGYKPFFFNRRSEYGRKHTYWEALCHTVFVESNNPADHVLKSASARYANRREGTAIDSLLIPATPEIGAFVDAVRAINAEYLDKLRDALVSSLNLAPALAQTFVDGVFRNVAIQYHFNEPSLTAAETMHLDHINSCLHMAVTLNGHRTVAFAKSQADPLELVMHKGDVYLTTPAAILHGIGVPKLSEADRSVALQLRTFLPVDKANELYAVDVGRLCLVILEQLKCCKIRMPTFEEWQKFLEKRKQLQVGKEGEAKRTITFTNYFRNTGKSAPVAEGAKEVILLSDKPSSMTSM